MNDTATDSIPDGPAFSPEAYAAVEKAAKSLRCLYVPSVLQHAAELLTALWATGEQHGIPASEWGWHGDLAGSALGGIARQYEQRPDPERTAEQVGALSGYLLAALTSEEIGLTAHLNPPYPGVIVDRGPNTPRGGFRGDADIEVRIYSNGGWDFAFAADGASVMSIVAPANEAGAAEVAAIVRDFVHGTLGNVFR